MCGIAGFYNTRVNQDQVDQIISRLKHRGPDAQDFFVKEDVGLIHTRLSIIELSDLGAQPYKFENLVLVLNGELYNYREVREELKLKGYSFISNSDTEVLIKAFHFWGENCVHHFIGMFAFAIYNQQTDDLFLFRDRLGVKPLYYGIRGKELFFASELKVFQAFNFSQDVNQQAVYSYFRFGFVPDDQSIFQDVYKLEPAHFLKVNREGVTKNRYWNPNKETDNKKTENEWVDELEALLISSFRYRMVSDVPVGVYLSGGIDSSLLTSILTKHHGGVQSFTIGFEEKSFDESEYALQVANHLKIKHTEKKLTRSEAKNLFDTFYSIYDEPFADTSGIPIAFITQLAKEAGMKVVLSADGGDELFGGYSRYQEVDKLYNSFSAIPGFARKSFSKTTQIVMPEKLRKKIFAFNYEHKLHALEELLHAPDFINFYEAFIANQSNVEILNLIPGIEAKQLADFRTDNQPIINMMKWDLRYYLPDDLLVKVDRATMFYGIESREPFLDHRLCELAMQIPLAFKIRNGENKYILKKVLDRYLPRKFFERKKQGFSIPIFHWFSEAFDTLFQEFLNPEKLRNIPFLNAKEVQHELKKYYFYKGKGKDYNVEKMWRILSLVMWWEKHGTKS